MRRLILVILIVTALAIAAHAQSKFSIYSNARFHYSIAYPSDLFTARVESDNGDGKVFRSTDGAELRVWGQYNVMFHSVREELSWNLKNEKDLFVTYRKVAPTWFVISGLKKGKVYYQKTLYHKFKSTDVFYTFTIEYPSEAKRLFDPLVKRIAESFRFDASANV